jgi:hypothetical protein
MSGPEEHTFAGSRAFYIRAMCEAKKLSQGNPAPGLFLNPVKVRLETSWVARLDSRKRFAGSSVTRAALVD